MRPPRFVRAATAAAMAAGGVAAAWSARPGHAASRDPAQRLPHLLDRVQAADGRVCRACRACRAGAATPR